MEDLGYEKYSEANINESNAVQKFRHNIAVFLVITNVILFLLLTISPLFNYTGKPAIYLYPKQPTKTNIKLSKTILIRTNIPKYHNGWNVLAYPNGKIVDLQP